MNKSVDYEPPVVLTQHTRALLTDYYRIGGRGTDSPSKPNSRQKCHSSSHSITSELQNDDHTFDSFYGSNSQSQDLDQATMTMIQNILLDRNVPRREKERISKSILDGNFEVQMVRSSSPKARKESRHFTHQKQPDSSVLRKQIKWKEGQLYVHRHSLPKPHFLELQPEALVIPRRTGRMIQDERLRLLRRGISTGYHPVDSVDYVMMENSVDSNIFEHNNSQTVEAADSLHQNSLGITPHYTTNNSADSSLIQIHDPNVSGNISGNNSPHRIPTVILPEYAKSHPHNPHNTSAAFLTETSHAPYSSLPKPKTLKKEAIAQDKQRKAETQRHQRTHDRKVISTLKENQKLKILTIVEQRKQIAAFRNSLKQHLEKTKHPLAGDILRCVTDSQIMTILTRYHGFELSPEAILALIGAALGTTPLDPSASISIDEDLNGDYDVNDNNDLHVGEAHRIRHTTRMLRHMFNSNESSDTLGGRNDTFHSRGPQSQGKSPHEQLTLTEPELLSFLPSDVIVHDFQGAMSQSSNYQGYSQRTPNRLPALRLEKHRQALMSQPHSPVQTGLKDEVIGYVPRNLDHIHSPVGEKKFASGFKVPPPSDSYSFKDQHKDSWQQQRDEWILTGKSALSNNKLLTNKVDPSAESLRMSNRLHGYLARQGIHAEQELDMDNLSTSQNSRSLLAVAQLPVIPFIASPPGTSTNHHSNRLLSQTQKDQNDDFGDQEDDQSVASAMAAMQEALQAEGRGRYEVIPPSVLTTDELQQIGTGAKRTETVLQNAMRQQQKLEKYRQLRLLAHHDHHSHHSHSNDDNDNHSVHSSYFNEAGEGGESGHNSILHGLPSLEELLAFEHQQHLANGLGITQPIIQPLYGAVTQPSMYYNTSEYAIDLEKESRDISTHTAKHMLVKKPLQGTPAERMDKLIIKLGGAPVSDGVHRQSPVALKTRSLKLGGGKGQPQLASISRSSKGAIDGQREPAPSPFLSSAHETKILSGGVPAGAGLALWRPRNGAVTPKGRYRDGHAERHNRRDVKKAGDKNELQVTPYVCAVSE